MVPVLLALAILSGAPADSVRAAVADLEKLEPIRRPQTRYLDLSHISEPQRDDAITSVNYALNAVSRARLVAIPELIGDLLRIDLAAYANLKDPAGFADIFRAWETLAVIDPAFHFQTQVVATGRVKTVTIDGGWVGLDQARRLRELTTSIGAILRADWFVAQVLQPPAYYEWSGIVAKESDFVAGLGLNLVEINRLAADSAANLFRSGITGKPRRVIYRPTPWGGAWFTHDVQREAPDKDPIRTPINFGVQKYNFDASEVFFTKANGFFGFALFTADGQRQNAVPPEIASDHTAPAGHQQLVPAISCIRCHALHGGIDAMQPFADDQTRLPQVISPEPVVAARVAELYNPARLNREMQRAREDYAAATMDATGIETKESAEIVSAVFARHVYEPITLAVAASELGVKPEALAVSLNGTADPMLLALQAGRKINRRSWEPSFPEAALRSAGAPPLAKSEKSNPLQQAAAPDARPLPPVVRVAVPRKKPSEKVAAK